MPKCLIEDCTHRTSRDTGPWICAVHWRRYCPPRSKRRRAYHAFFREAKRTGWTDDLCARYYRFWNLMVRSAHARHRADAVDMTEINKLFGWDR